MGLNMFKGADVDLDFVFLIWRTQPKNAFEKLMRDLKIEM